MTSPPADDPIEHTYTADYFRLDVAKSGAGVLSSGTDRWRWSTPIPPLAIFAFGFESQILALVSQPHGSQFDVDTFSINGSHMDHATLDGAPTRAAFIRHGTAVELDKASGTRAWMELAWNSQAPIANAFVAELPSASAVPSRASVEQAAKTLCAGNTALRDGLDRIEVTPPFPSAARSVTYYCYAEALFADWNGKATGVPLPADTSLFAAFTASAGSPTLTVANEHFDAFQPASRSLGSVTETAVRSFERERDRAEAALVASVFAGSSVPDPVKVSYCFWATLHPALVKTLAAKHAAFFASLRC
jgi:hypothetical protein